MSVRKGIGALGLWALLCGLLGCVTVEEDGGDLRRKGPATGAEVFTVREVLSGDLVHLETGEMVRYAGIRAPRPDEEYFEEARQANMRLVFGKGVQVRVQFVEGKKDDDGNRYAHIYTPSQTLKLMTWVNAELLEGGFGRLDYRALTSSFHKRFEEREAAARTARRGIWKERG
jgi:endonuclease YncB( thermonuclease family)